MVNDVFNPEILVKKGSFQPLVFKSNKPRIAFFIQHSSDIFVLMMQSTIFHSTNCIYKSAIHFFLSARVNHSFERFCISCSVQGRLRRNVCDTRNIFLAPPLEKFWGGGKIILGREGVNSSSLIYGSFRSGG